MKLKFSSSEEFKSYSKSISNHIKNTPLRPLRLAMAKVEGFSSVQAYCAELDKNTNVVKTPYLTNGTVQIKEDRIEFTTTVKLNQLFKRNGIEAWNDHIQDSMMIDSVLHAPNAEPLSGFHDSLFECSGYIPLEDISTSEKDDVIESFLSSHKNTNVHIIAKCLIETAKNYIFESLEEGDTLEEYFGKRIGADELSGFIMTIDESLFLSSLPEKIVTETEKDILHEVGIDSELTCNDIKNMVIKDLFEICLSMTINEYGNELLSSLEKESMDLRAWHKALDNSMGVNPAIEAQEYVLEAVSSKLIKGRLFS